jgi:hypothetical protein
MICSVCRQAACVDMADGNAGIGLDHPTGDRQLTAHDRFGDVSRSCSPNHRITAVSLDRRHGRLPSGHQRPDESTDRLGMFVDHLL